VAFRTGWCLQVEHVIAAAMYFEPQMNADERGFRLRRRCVPPVCSSAILNLAEACLPPHVMAGLDLQLRDIADTCSERWLTV
jgi:hypothetical protein